MKEEIKVELGCGSTKNEGYIGIDRFPLPNVDIVADLDKGIPLEENSVDVIFCSHSLEHFNNLEDIFKEIYRVCKHKAIINILAPYHMETVNLANFYHKQVFNEATFRFFTSDSNTLIDKKEYFNPHASFWGLSSSDNGNHSINLFTLNIEYFYFPSYEKLSYEEKRNARRSLLNVCDQIYYSLAVNKSKNMFTKKEILELKEKAKRLELPIIQNVRSRNNNSNLSTSIIDDVKKWDKNLEESITNRINSFDVNIQNECNRKNQEIMNLLKVSEQETTKKFERMNESLNNKINQNMLDFISNVNLCEKKIEKKIENTISKNQEKFEQIENEFNKKLVELNENYLNYIYSLREQLNIAVNEKNSITAITLDLLKSSESHSLIHRHFKFFRKKVDIFESIRINHTYYTDGLIISNKCFNKRSIVTVSKTIPYDRYFEYKLNGYGNKINFFLFSNIGAKLFLEVVLNGNIIKQESFVVSYEGMYSCILPEYVKDEVFIRFKTLDNISICRVLEIVNRNWFFFERRALGAFLE